MAKTLTQAGPGEQASRASLLPAATALEALTGLHRAVSATQFYPARHAVLEGATQDALRAWRSFEGDYRLEVPGLQLREGGLWLGEARIGEGSPAVASLARAFASHGVATLRRTGELDDAGFAALVTLFAASPELHAAGGGLAVCWAQSPHGGALELRGLAATRKVSAGSAGSAGPAGREEWGGGLPMGREAAVLSDPLVLGRLDFFHQKGPRERRIHDLLLRVARAVGIQEFLDLLREVVRVTDGYLDEERYREAFQVVLCLYREAREMDAAGRHAQRDYFIDTVRLLLRGPFLEWLVAQVATARGDEEAEVGEYVLRTLGRGAVVPVINALVAERSRTGRRRLVDVLVSLGDTAVSWAVKMLEDRRWFVVRNMVTVLGGVGTPDAVRALLKATRDPDARIRREVARALGRAATPEGEEALVGLLGDPDPSVRLMAIAAAGSHKSPQVLAALWKAFRAQPLRSPDWGIKVAIAQAMGRLGFQGAVPLLGDVLGRRPLFYRDRWDQVRRTAVRALGDLGGAEAVTILSRLHEDRSPEVRAAVIRALAAVRGEAGEPTP